MKSLILIALLAMSSFASCAPAFAQDSESIYIDEQLQQAEIQQQIEDQRVQADERQMEMQEQMKAQQDQIEEQREKMEALEMGGEY